MLIEEGHAKVNRCDFEGWTALHHSAEVRPNLAVMNYLVNVANIDISIKNSADMTAFDLLLNHHSESRLVPDSYLHCVDLLANVYLPRADCYSFGTILSYFLNCVTFDRNSLIDKIIDEFYGEQLNSKNAVLQAFIRAFSIPELNSSYYAFCMVLHPRIKEVRSFNFRQFSAVFPDVLREALQTQDKFEAFLQCIQVIHEILPGSEKYIMPHISELDYNPVSRGDICRLFKLYETLLLLNYKVDFNGIAFRHFLHVLSTGSKRSLKHLEIILAFCTDNFIRLNRFCYTFNMKLDNETRSCVNEADLPLEMKGPEFLPSLKELARKAIRAVIYDALLVQGNRIGLPPELYYKNKLYVDKIQALDLPPVLQRYLRFMDRISV